MWTMSTALSRVRFTVDDYHRMAEVGILNPGQRVELLDGEIVEMTPIGAKHAYCVAELCGLLRDQLGDAYLVFPQNPIQINEHTEPEPDLAIINRSSIRSRDQLPSARDVRLLIEVAESSLEKDTQIKLPLYAKAGVVEVWIADLTSRTLHVYRRPADGKYAEHQTITGDQSITPVNFPDLAVAIPQVFGS